MLINITGYDTDGFKTIAEGSKDTNELFDIVLQRILDETEHLYPLVRSLRYVA